MKRGLVIGKFLPLHKGHIALIEFAAERCDELIVSMSYSTRDPIDATQRFRWITEMFRDNRKIIPSRLCDDFDDESLPMEQRTKIWASLIREKYPPIDIIFSSETYSVPFSAHLGAKNMIFDLRRNKVPISATRIRQAPFRYWEFIPEVVRPWFVRKFCFFGPESTGKSVMAEQMAARYETCFVPEVAREMISSNSFTLEDIERIARAHLERLEHQLRRANKVIFCDTDVLTTRIYSEHYLQAAPALLDAIERRVRYDHYFLFDVDVPWVPDGLRDLGERRDEMFRVFERTLTERSIPYTLVRGTWEERKSIIERKVGTYIAMLS